MAAPIFDDTSIIPPRFSHPWRLSSWIVWPARCHCAILAIDLPMGVITWSCERDRTEHPLHRRARLEGVLHRGIVQAVVNVDAVGIDIGERQHFAGKRIEHHRGAAPRAAALDLVGQVIFGRATGSTNRSSAPDARPAAALLSAERLNRKSDARARHGRNCNSTGSPRTSLSYCSSTPESPWPSIPANPTTDAARLLSG